MSAELAAFRQRLPLLLLTLCARINAVGGEATFVQLLSPVLTFKLCDRTGQLPNEDGTLGLEADEWQFQMIDNSVTAWEEHRTKEQRRLELRREVWDRLSEDERAAMGMQFRP